MPLFLNVLDPSRSGKPEVLLASFRCKSAVLSRQIRPVAGTRVAELAAEGDTNLEKIAQIALDAGRAYQKSVQGKAAKKRR